VPGLEQHRQHVVALAALLAPLRDQGEDDLVHLFLVADELRERPDPFGGLGDAPVGPRRHQADRLVAEGEHRLQPLAQGVEAGPRLDAEDGAEDDLQRQLLHPRVEGHRHAARQRRHLFGGNLGHQAGEALHPLAMEGGQDQLALLHVSAFVEQDHRVGPDDRLQHTSALSRLQHVRRCGEDFLHLVRVAQHHERRRQREADGEAPAVARAAALEVGERPHPEAEELDGRGSCGTGR
jgi:hypothetical protein